MSNFEPRHPEEGWLLRYIDGELPVRKQRQMERHLEACWQCRTELEELKKTVAGCVRYRQAMEAHLPAPTQPWRDLGREFDRIDAAQVSWTALSYLWRWAIPAAAAAALAVVLWHQLRVTPAVEAAALLKRAVAAADSRHEPGS